MLDNLKLGYGGTKTEMERLISDANKLAQAQGQAGDLTIESYADIVEAIHLVQDNMGITGTTAKEASTTIQGSVNSMKSAWNNLLVGIADDNADFTGLMDNMIDSVITVAENLIPRVQEVLKKLPDLINGLIPRLISIIEGILPDLLSAVTKLIQSLVSALPNLLQSIINAIINLLPE